MVFTCTLRDESLFVYHQYIITAKSVRTIVKEQIDAEGRVTSYSYDAFGRLAQMTDADGHVSREVRKYDGIDRPIIMVDTFGQATQYDYQDTIRKTVMTHALGTTTDTYDAVGNMIGMIDRVGRATEYTYDKLNRRTKMKDWSGAETLYGYDAVGNMLSMTDARNHTTSYVYDDLNRRVKSIDAVGKATVTDYDAVGNILAMTDRLGHKTSYVYDQVNRQRFTTTALGNVFEQKYDKVGNVVQRIDALGRQTVYSYDGLNRMIGMVDAEQQSTATGYDKVGNVLSQTDALGRVTTYKYDNLNRRQGMTDALGYVTQTLYNLDGTVKQHVDAEGRATNYSYDAFGRLAKVTEADGHVSRQVTKYDGIDRALITVDTFGQATQYNYNDVGRETTMTHALGTITDTYDAVGNMVGMIDRAGRASTYTYDELNRRVAVKDWSGAVTQYGYDAVGNMLSMTDGRGNTSNYVYDDQNRRVKSIDALNEVTTTDYDGVDNAIAVTDPLGHKTSYIYDKVNRLRFTTTPLGNVFEQQYDKVSNVVTKVDALGRTTGYTYDALNRMIQMTDAIDGISTTSYDGVGNVLTMTDELGRNTDYDYDLLNRRTKSTNALGYVAETVYNADGTVQKLIDAEGRVTSFGYDKFGRSNKVTDPSGYVVSQTSYDAIDRAVIMVDRFGQFTTYTYDDANRQTTITQPLQSRLETYDANGNMIQSVDQSGRITKHEYDKLNRENKMVAADGGVTLHKYDAAGRLEYVRDPSLNFTNYSYDADDRLIQETDPLGTRSYGYDNAGNRTSAIDRNNRTRSFKFDDLNRIVEEKWIGDGKTFAYGYDAAGNLLSEDDGATKHDYVYDSLNRVTSDQTGALKYEYQYDKVNNLTKDIESIGLGKVITNYVYDSRNLLTNLDRGAQSVMFSYRTDGLRSKVERKTTNGETVSSDYSYDAYGRLTELKHSAGKIVLSDNLYVLDNFDRLIKEVRNGQDRQIGYDSTNQVTSVAGVSNETYSYDQNGNRLTNTTDTGNRLISDGVYDYVYDAEGNRIQRKSIAFGEVTTYQWDYRNRLTGVQIGAKSIAYSYDSQDRRIAKFVDGALVERYGHDGTDLAVVFDAAGQVAQRYLYGGSIDEVLAEETLTSLNWSLADRLGTVDLIVDDKGGVIDRVTFDSFGNKVSESAPAKAFRFGFTGRELDPETGLYYYRARYYDPLVGRFISVDSIGFQAGDTNLYRYVFNSPTRGIDPTGHGFDLGQSWNNFWGGVQSAAEAVSDGTRYVIDSVYNGIGNAAQESLEYYAQLAVDGEKEGGVFGFGKQVIGTTGGVLSALATKENLWKTGAVLTAGVFAAPALAAVGSTTGIVGFGAQTATTGGLFVGAIDVVSQDIKIIEGRQKEFKWDEFAIASASGAAFGLLAATSPYAGAFLFGFGTTSGLIHGSEEILAGHPLSGWFEIATSLIPLAGVKSLGNGVKDLPTEWGALHKAWQESAAKAANEAFHRDLRDLLPWNKNEAKSEPETGGFIRDLSDEEAGAVWGRGSDEHNPISDPWFENHEPNQVNISHGNQEPQPSATLVPGGYADGSIVATPSRMLPSSNQPGTIISRTASRQAHSGEFVTIQGKDTTFKSGDMLVPEIVSAMETKNPGVTQGVESIVYKTDGSRERLTDVDIVTQNELFQVKTGSAKGLLKQLNETSTIPGG